MIAGVLHFSFTVSDIERSVAWYTEVLGLELVHRQRQDNPYTRTLVGFPDAVLEVAQLRVPGVSPGVSTHMLELIQYVEGAAPADPPRVNAVGGAHLAILVDDARAEYDRLLAAGVAFANPLVEVTEGANTGALACYFQDPDGIALELMQFPPQRAASLGIPVPAWTS
jgi:catechol 2,3-dioxygenase-like lactoylglutathione lyase family enzyme